MNLEKWKVTLGQIKYLFAAYLTMPVKRLRNFERMGSRDTPLTPCGLTEILSRIVLEGQGKSVNKLQ
jgi:hypothetical protein